MQNDSKSCERETHSRSGNPEPIPFGVERFITKRRLPSSLSHQAMTVSPSFRREMLEG
jgi:hypothetical protein